MLTLIFEWHAHNGEAFDCSSFVSIIIRSKLKFVTDDYKLFTHPIDDNGVTVVVEINKNMNDRSIDMLMAEIEHALDHL